MLFTEDEDRSNEQSVQNDIMELIGGADIDDTGLVGASTRSYADAGVMTNNAGFEIYTMDGCRFQVTIVRVG